MDQDTISADRLSRDTHRQTLRLQPGSLAGDARARHHEAGQIFSQGVLAVILTVQKIDESRYARCPAP